MRSKTPLSVYKKVCNSDKNKQIAGYETITAITNQWLVHYNDTNKHYDSHVKVKLHEMTFITKSVSYLVYHVHLAALALLYSVCVQ